MYNILIAEDSKPILRNICGLVENSDLPVKVVATASNGDEAIMAFHSHTIDILLTDIRMPKMDGLLLIERLKQMKPELKSVLISGYNDFEYARKAINLGVNDYLLKPVEKQDLIEVMKKIMTELQHTREQASTLFNGIIPNSYWPTLSHEQQFYQNQKIALILRKQPFIQDDGKFSPDYIAPLLHAPVPLWAIPMSNDDHLIIIADSHWLDNYSSPIKWISDMKERLTCSDIQASAAYLSHPTYWNLLPEHCHKALQMLAEQSTLNQPIHIESDTVSCSLPLVSADHEERVRTLQALIEESQSDQFVLVLTEVLTKWRRENVHLYEVKHLIKSLSLSFAHRLNHLSDSDSLTRLSDMDNLFLLPSYDIFGAELIKITKDCFNTIKLHNKKSGEALFEQLEQYLETNLYRDTAMSDLVRQFHVSPSYISRIIKRYTGRTFVHFYTDLKIREAKKLMEDKPEMLIKDISNLLCFGDQHYFSKVFKEHVGLSPLEFRRTIHHN